MREICFIVLFIIQSIGADSDPIIIEGIIEDANQREHGGTHSANQEISNEPRNGRQFQQLQARSSSSSKQNPEELVSGRQQKY